MDNIIERGPFQQQKFISFEKEKKLKVLKSTLLN